MLARSLRRHKNSLRWRWAQWNRWPNDMTVNELAHYCIVSVSAWNSSVCICVSVKVHDLPERKASALKLCHIIVPKPRWYHSASDSNDAGGNCHDENEGWSQLMNKTSECATRGCLYVAWLPRLVMRWARACVRLNASVLCNRILCTEALGSMYSPIEYL